MSPPGVHRRGAVHRTPHEDASCGWLAALPPLPPPRRLTGVERADALVLGAGLTGLAAARRLAELRPSWRVLLLDAQRVGEGASARSSGFVVALAHFVARKSEADARRFVHLSRRGIAALERLVDEHGIDCAWDARGWLHVAAGAPAEASLAKLETWLRGLGEAYERLDATALAGVVGTTYYRAGVRLPGSVLVQPAALVRGLAASLPEGVELFEGSPVGRLSSRGRFVAETPGGRVVADRLLLTANGYLASLGFLRRRLFPLYTFGSLTRPLDPAEQEAIGGEREWGVLAEDPLGSTVRRTRDQRILIRNTVRYRPGLQVPERQRTVARDAHRRALLDRFPALREVALEHTWAGAMGMSLNHEHFFGSLAEGLFATGGFNGAGIAFGTTCGELLAELAAGERSDDLDAMRTLPGPSWIPPDPLLGLGVRFHLSRLEARAAGRI